MNQVSFVTTKWTEVGNIRTATERAQELGQDHWGEMRKLGAKLHHLVENPSIDTPNLRPQVDGSRVDSPWAIIHSLVMTMHLRDTILLIQDELVNKKRFILESGAGRALRTSLKELLKEAKRLRAEAMSEAGNDEAKISLQARQEEVVKIMEQLARLKPSLGDRVRRFFAIA
jgi:hypothetical protein